jgi:riboflavin biosynthesis pyrimidine reductase
LEEEGYIRLDDPATAIATLTEMGFERILLETGPTLSKFFLETGQIDEFCLTVTNGDLEVAAKTVAGFGVDLKLLGAAEVEGTLFTSWRRGNGD